MKKFFIFALLMLVGVTAFAAESAEWFAKYFPEELVNAEGKKFETASLLKGKMVAVYFSASWCPPCRKFTPELVKFYKKVAKKSNLEIVFVSSDRDEKSMNAYLKKMPWYAIPFGDAKKPVLARELQVRGIPTLAVFDANGKLITKNGRADVMRFKNKAAEEWSQYNVASESGKSAKKSKKSEKKSEKQ